MESDPLVASNYARALLSVVKKGDVKLEDARDEARTLRALVQGDPKLRVFLYGPQFREETKKELVEKVFKDRLSQIFYQLLHLLINRDRIQHLIDILAVFDQLAEEELGFKLATVTTAVELSDGHRAAFQQKLEAYWNVKFDLSFKVDPKTIGGVRVKYNDVLMDTTIENYLLSLREHLSQIRLAS